jgi:hypothetical protein
MNKELQKIISENKVSKDNAKKLLEAFGAPFTEAGEILADYIKEDEHGNPVLSLADSAIKVEDEDDSATMAAAREKRLKLWHIKCAAENKRKNLKEDSLRIGRAIDAAAKAIKLPVEIAEKYLESQEKYAELLAEKRRLLIIESRGAILQKYVERADLYKFEDLTDDDFNKLIADLKKQKFEREEEARLAEEKRKAAVEAERKRQANIEAENAKLKKEAEERENELRIEREASAKKEAEAHAEAKKIQDAKDAELRAERKKREAIEAEQRAKTEMEAKEKAEAEAEIARAKAKADEAERQALLAPDKDKLITFSNALEIVRKQKLPAVKTKQAQDVVNLIDRMLIGMQMIILAKSKEL